MDFFFKVDLVYKVYYVDQRRGQSMDGYADLHTNHIYRCHAWYCGANIG